MVFLKIIALAIALVAIAFAGLAISILLKKGGKFPNTHVRGNKTLKQRGIFCAQTQDRLEQKKAWGKPDYQQLRVDKKP